VIYYVQEVRKPMPRMMNLGELKAVLGKHDISIDRLSKILDCHYHTAVKRKSGEGWTVKDVNIFAEHLKLSEHEVTQIFYNA
jgi:hypothetical protein